MFVLAGTHFVLAQKNSYVISYEITKDLGDQLLQVPEQFREQVKAQLAAPEFFELTITGNESIYENVASKLNKDEELTSKSNVQVIAVGGGMSKKSKVYINQKQKSYIKGINVLDKDFLIKSNLPQFDWKITSETKQIGDITVQKATSTMKNGEMVEAWYAPELPFPLGPDTYGGLPGLIVELKTLIFHCIATGVQKSDIKAITPPSKGKKVTEEELVDIMREVSETMGGTSRKSTIR